MSLRDRIRPRAPDAAPAAAAPPRALLLKRDRLVERFTALQLDLGGAYYEMAIRDHLRHDVLTAKAAELQRELKAIELVIQTGATSATRCRSCNAVLAEETPFCWQCGAPREP